MSALLGTKYLMIILQWCTWPAYPSSVDVRNCRKQKIECISHLPEGWNTDDAVVKCLMK